MTPELKQRIEYEAEAWRLRPVSQYRSDHDFIFQIDGSEIENIYTAGATPWAEEVERLERWKSEASQLLDPLISYGQSHPDIKLGTGCTEFVLNRAKAYDALLEKTEKLREALEEIADPVLALQKAAVADGCLLDGAMAMSLAGNAPYLRMKAREALEQYKKETE